MLPLLLAAGTLFPTQTRLAVAPGENGIAIADLNADGARDLVVLEHAAGRVAILIGDGKGHFRGPTRFDAGRSPYCVAIADFDGDGKLDLAISNHDERHLTLL